MKYPSWKVFRTLYTYSIFNTILKLFPHTASQEEWGRRYNVSLLDQHSELKRLAEARALSAAERQAREEEHILESVAQSKALMGVAELAKGKYF